MKLSEVICELTDRHLETQEDPPVRVQIDGRNYEVTRIEGDTAEVVLQISDQAS